MLTSVIDMFMFLQGILTPVCVMRHENKWKHGTVESRHETPRSYVVQTSDGRKYRRNRKHIRPKKSVPKRRVAGPRSAVGNVSGYRCVSDCRSRGREFDPGPVPYFRGD